MVGRYSVHSTGTQRQWRMFNGIDSRHSNETKFILAKASHVMQFVAHTFIQNNFFVVVVSVETIVYGKRRPSSTNKSQSVVVM